MDFDECLKQGLIKRNKDALQRIRKEVEIAGKFFNSSKRNFGIEEYEMTVIASYNSIFHCCRALLFNKGFVERSHLCLLISVQALYHEDKRILDFLKSINKVRISRHQVQYRGDMAGSEEAEFVLDLNKRFLNYIRVKLK